MILGATIPQWFAGRREAGEILLIALVFIGGLGLGPDLISAATQLFVPIWCFGCSRGGRIVDLASLLAGGSWGREVRDEAFLHAP